MRGVLALLLVCTTVSGQISLRCRRCVGASSLDECTFSVPCGGDEVCYMDEVLTEQLTIEYNGGCRPRDVCSKGAAVGKRSGNYIICSQCCDTHTHPACNAKLCGIKSSMSSVSQCYQCASGRGVNDPSQCHSLVTCQSDQVCAAETYVLSVHKTYEFRCMHKGICTLLTVEALKRMDECRQPGASPAMCALTKRETSGTRVCMACCGDSQCNSESCEQLLERLYNLWKGGVLDLHTLKTNATVLTTPTTPGTTPASG